MRQSTRLVTSLAASLGAVLMLTNAPAASAVAGVGASDTATPNYLSSATPTAGANEFRCTGGGCSITIKTKTTPYPCTSELIVLADTQTPGLLYQNTFCSVAITGFFEAPLGEPGRTCVLEAAQTLQVAFSSGVNSAFNGTFPATGTFKPTGVNTNGYITSAVISIKAGGQILGNPTASGTVKASFQVRFSGSGLSPFCNAASTGLTTVTSGTVITRF